MTTGRDRRVGLLARWRSPQCRRLQLRKGFSRSAPTSWVEQPTSPGSLASRSVRYANGVSIYWKILVRKHKLRGVSRYGMISAIRRDIDGSIGISVMAKSIYSSAPHFDPMLCDALSQYRYT